MNGRARLQAEGRLIQQYQSEYTIITDHHRRLNPNSKQVFVSSIKLLVEKHAEEYGQLVKTARAELTPVEG